MTLSKEVLHHLGVAPGEQIELTLLPHSRVQLKALRTKNSFKQLHSMLENKTNGAHLSIEEINEAIARVAINGMTDNPKKSES